MDANATPEVTVRLLDFVERSADLVGMLDGDGRVVYVNETARKRLGYTDLAGLTAEDFFGSGAFERYYAEIRPTLVRAGRWEGEVAILTQAGDAIPVSLELVADVAAGGEVRGIVAHGTPKDGATLAMANARRVGVLHVTVADLRDLAQTHGEFVADGVMRAVERRLKLAARASDTVVRSADDAFVVVFVDLRDVAELLRVQQSLRHVFERERVWTAVGEVAVAVEVRAVVETASGTPEQSFPAAPREREITSVSARVDTVRGLDAVVEAEHEASYPASAALRLAIMRGDVLSYVAPLVDRDGVVAGYEAFARWSHADLAPGREALYQLMNDVPGADAVIDLRVLREAAVVAATSAGAVAPGIFARLDASLLDDVYVEQYVWEIADATQLSAERIHLMLDRRLFSARDAKTRHTIQSLRDNGYAIVVMHVDDESEMSTLVQDFGVTAIRLVHDAVPRASADEGARLDLDRLVAATHEAGASVVASGVATTSQLRLAREAGVDLAGGDACGAAVPAHHIV